MNLLRRGKLVYSARLSEEIAQQLKPQTLFARSPSFREFCSAVRNGPLADDAQ